MKGGRRMKGGRVMRADGLYCGQSLAPPTHRILLF